MREALGERLSHEALLNIVGTACDADEAITIVKEHMPDVVVMDIDMPGLLCFDAA